MKSIIHFYLFLAMLLGVVAELRAQDTSLQTAGGFALPQPGKVFAFPRDHGSHPDFKIEWWYVTGHLFAEDGRRFGFQATFFRQANKNEGAETPLFQHRQLHLAHMALLDAKTGRFLHEERLNRAGWDADSSVSTLDVRNGNWSLRLLDENTNRMALRGTLEGEASFELEMAPQKPLVVFGENSVSRKAALPSAASYYLTFPRLQCNGALKLGGETLKVSGEAWMDHEISSSQLSGEQEGWDWAAIQLRDGREIMVYRLRLKNGGIDAHSTLSWVDAQSRVQTVKSEGFVWKPLGTWTSSVTKAKYPIRVEIESQDPATGKPLRLRLEPLAEAQEQTGSVGGTAYWEGACRVLDEQGKEIGSAFLELAGYNGDLSQRFK